MSAALEVQREVGRALEALGLRARNRILVSPLRERKGVRLAFRVELEDGRTVKARHFVSEEAARRHLVLRRGLEEAFAPALARHGAVLIEEWVEGTPFGDADVEARVDEAGALLGRLHATPLAADVPSTVSTDRWTEAAGTDIHLLGGAGQLSPDAVARLRAELARRDPGVTRLVLVHRDFCAENMLIDTRGRLRVIDNEQLEPAAAGLDLGRTFHRWPMSGATWTRFLRAYRGTAPAPPEALGFWKIAAALESARVCFQRRPARLAASLAALGRLAETQGPGDPA